jgi:Ser/Thr protein kinase RdoA (MazF antagonist)
MAVDEKIERILHLYPDDCQPHSLEALVSGQGFSGARIWRVQSNRGPLCLRRWPAEHPSPERLEFIQAVLWHVDQEGFRLIPVPLETRHRHGYLRHAGHLWELTPWLPGEADCQPSPGLERLCAALAALARFHHAAASFPLPDIAPAVSPGMLERRDRMHAWLDGRTELLSSSITPGVWPQLASRACELIGLFSKAAPATLKLVQAAAHLEVDIQPCIRDIWRPHVLFSGNDVSGIVDFGSMRPDNVATDVARLLGSLAGDDQRAWQRGLAAYESVRSLSDEELILARAFDRTTVLMGGLQWLEWIYLERRTFASRAAVLARVDEFLSRLAFYCQSLG